jgi:hypothetical protein
MKSVEMYWKIINMEMNLWELAIYLNILNIPKDCQRIWGDFIFTVVCRDYDAETSRHMHYIPIAEGMIRDMKHITFPEGVFDEYRLLSLVSTLEQLFQLLRCSITSADIDEMWKIRGDFFRDLIKLCGGTDSPSDSQKSWRDIPVALNAASATFAHVTKGSMTI